MPGSDQSPRATGRTPHGRLERADRYPPNSGQRCPSDSVHPARAIQDPLAIGHTDSQLTGHSGWISSCEFSPSGGQIVSGSADHLLKLWDANTGAELATLSGHTNGVTDCVFSPDGRWVASASSDHTVRLWDAVTGREISTLIGHGLPVRICSVSPDGQRLLSASWDCLKIWNLAREAVEAEYPLDSGITCGAGWAAPDKLAVGTASGTVELFSLEQAPRYPILVTGWRRTTLFRRQAGVHIGCPICRAWFEASPTANELACPRCAAGLRLNAFTIDADWRPLAQAWGLQP